MAKRHKRRELLERGYTRALRHVIRLTEEAKRRYTALHTQDMVEILRAELSDIQAGRQ
jgi:hypothetical protein